MLLLIAWVRKEKFLASRNSYFLVIVDMKVNFFRRNLFQRVTFAGDVDKVIFKKFEKTDAFGDFTVFVRVDKQIHFIGRQVVDVLCQSRKADIRNFEGNTGGRSLYLINNRQKDAEESVVDDSQTKVLRKTGRIEDLLLRECQ